MFPNNDLHTLRTKGPPLVADWDFGPAAAARHTPFPNAVISVEDSWGPEPPGLAPRPLLRLAKPCVCPMGRRNCQAALDDFDPLGLAHQSAWGAWSLGLYVAPSVILHCCWPCHSLNRPQFSPIHSRPLVVDQQSRGCTLGCIPKPRM
jgi:hypothetical protein